MLSHAALAREQPVDSAGQVSGILAHPQTVCRQPFVCPDLDGEEAGCHNASAGNLLLAPVHGFEIRSRPPQSGECRNLCYDNQGNHVPQL